MRSDNLRPSHEICKSTVAPWEKKFCSTVGSIPWRQFLEMKSYTHLYEKVAEWDDSAGEEAFNEAKNRFWAKTKGLPCDISLPDPDIYIDAVDWDSGVDLELFLDLEREPEISAADHSQDENEVPLTQAVLTSQSFSCAGWGETEEYFQKIKESQSPGMEPRESRTSLGIFKDNLRGCSFDLARGNVTGWYDSRYKASRFPRNDYPRRKLVSFANEKHCLRQWAMKS